MGYQEIAEYIHNQGKEMSAANFAFIFSLDPVFDQYSSKVIAQLGQIRENSEPDYTKIITDGNSITYKMKTADEIAGELRQNLEKKLPESHRHLVRPMMLSLEYICERMPAGQ